MLALLEDATGRFPCDAELSLRLGQAYNQTSEKASAYDWLSHAYQLDPCLPDVRYHLGSLHLEWDKPLTALDLMWCAPTSKQEMAWSQDLATGAALGQLNLLTEASSYYLTVAEAADGTELGQLALQYQDELNETLLSRESLRGSFKATCRYDNRPSVLPTFNAVGVPLPSEPSFGSLFLGQLGYDIYRGYNSDLTLGCTFLNTQNYSEHDFDQLDNVAYALFQRRTYWRGMPTFAGARIDYDYLTVGMESFLQRAGAAPYVTFLNDDYRSTTLHGRYGIYDFKGLGIFDDTIYDLDSVNYMVGVTRRRRFACREMSAWAGYQFDRNESDGSLNCFTGHKLLAGVVCNLPYACAQLDLTSELYFRGYDIPDPFLGFARRDTEFLLHGTLLVPLQENLFLTCDLVYDSNESNFQSVPLNNQYHHLTFDVGLEYRFPNSWTRRSLEIR